MLDSASNRNRTLCHSLEDSCLSVRLLEAKTFLRKIKKDLVITFGVKLYFNEIMQSDWSIEGV